MKKKILKITAFLLAVALTFTGSVYVLDFKYLDSVFKLDSFYQQEDNTVDVLVLGSSHAYQGINTAVLWEEYGIASFDLCGAAQPMWNTYFYLEEALKTQSPKAIILDVYYAHMSTEYSEESVAIKNTYGLKWSETKINAIKESFDTEKSGRQYFFSILQYHSRYSDINEADFYPYQGNEDMYADHKGFYCYFRSENVSERDLTDINYINEMTDKTEYYYRKTIELAQSKNIPILVTAIPFNAEAYHQGFFNQCEQIANEYGVPFYNFITTYNDALNLDYTTDFADAQHLNYLGNTKLSRFFGDILKNQYNVPDRRGNELYESWEADAEVYYDQLENHENSKISKITDYAPVIENDRYTVIVTLTCEDYSKVSSINKMLVMSLIGDHIKKDTSQNSVWVIEGGELTYYASDTDEDYTKYIALGRNDGALIKNSIVADEDGDEYTVSDIYFNKSRASITHNGLNIFVYDNLTGSKVDSVCVGFAKSEFVR